MQAGIEAFVRDLVGADCDSIYDAISQCKFQQHHLILQVIEDVQRYEDLWMASYFTVDVNTDLNCVLEYLLEDVFNKFVTILNGVNQGFYTDINDAYREACRTKCPDILLFEMEIRTQSKSYWEILKSKVAIETLQQNKV